MLDFDAGKLLIVGVIALIFIPPKDLPRALRQAGQFVAKMRRLAAEFQGQFMEAMREADMAEVRREAQKLADAARVDMGLDSIHDLDRQMVAKRPAEPAPVAEPAPMEELPSPAAPRLEQASPPDRTPAASEVHSA